MDFKVCSGSLAICRSHPLFTFALLQSFVGVSLNQFFLLPVKFLCHKHLMDPAILGPKAKHRNMQRDWALYYFCNLFNYIPNSL